MQESRIRRRNDFEEYCYRARESIEPLESAVQATLDWMHGSDISSQSDVELEQRQNAIVELVRVVLPPGYFIGRDAGDSAPDTH